ncbi:hypothetical protein I6F30_33580 [Bradyrhizobium sp. NBAIM20]|uniref:hypothetical protein n=1 Tax=unclassified Bradyrhizobium TaxID=2631580 RepID=UPI001CD7892B|nr:MULTISPECIES: hypothetical protein [unclassified Bradyrhizobium]MCA1416020.1 hypothetical protein [Bradyrhizobium sp. NBAIM20]MCA1466060.1 hypothetical protein [Bradyrhizobium sp. NBAIM18]
MNPPVKPGDQDAMAAIANLLDTHEARVLGAVGLFIGYLCVLLTKIMNFTQMYVGLLGVVGLTIVLLLLGGGNIRTRIWWLRTTIVVFLAILLTAPQLYFAWTVSVAEVQANALLAQSNQVKQLSNQYVQPEISVGKKK